MFASLLQLICYYLYADSVKLLLQHLCYNIFAVNLGKNIEKYRKQADLSREKLAFKCGGKFTSNHLLRVERGIVKNPGIEMIKAIAGMLAISVDQLLK